MSEGLWVPVSDRWLHDNDVVIKICAYQLLDELRLVWGSKKPTVLGISVFSLPSQMARHRGIRDRAGAKAELHRFLEVTEVIEPQQREIELAAGLEEEALRRGLPLDGGESQLVAILFLRGMSLLLTGDKRAIRALHALAQPDVDGRVACLEQLMGSMVRRSSDRAIRSQVCAEPGADKALTACFACASATTSADTILAGLASYVRHLRARSGDILMAGDDLSAVIA